MNAVLLRPPLSVGRVIRAILVVLLALAWLAPTVGLLVTSLRPQADIAASGWWTIVTAPRFTFDNYSSVLTARHFLMNFLNSFIITIPATVLPIVIGALAAFAFSWLRFRGRNVVFLVIVALLVLPLQETWVPVLRMHSTPRAHGPLPRHLARPHRVRPPVRDLSPAQLLRRAPAGAVRGGKDGRLRRFRRLPAHRPPAVGPGLASLGIFQFVWVWNDLMNALVLLQDQHKFPLTVAIQSLLGSYGSEWNILASGAFISMSVPLLVFFVLQRYFVQGITAGAVKG